VPWESVPGLPLHAAPRYSALELAFAVGDCDPEEALAEENSFGVVPKSAMPEISHEGRRLIKPGVDWKVILGAAAESPGTAFCVPHWVGHG
jgi:hypothetical protein